MPYTKLCRKWHIDRQKEKDREKELIGSVSVINRVFVVPGSIENYIHNLATSKLYKSP